MAMEVDKHLLDRINSEHQSVLTSSKQAIHHAIKAGELLTELKDICEHGQFIQAIGMNFDFDRTTAFRYMRCYEYSANVSSLQHLQEAYKLIESEENKKKLAESQETAKRLEYRDKYGEKPEGWQRSDDYAWQKMQAENKARDERIEDFKLKSDIKSQESRLEQEELNIATDELRNYFKQEQAKSDQLNNLKITNTGGILELIDSYLAGLATDDKRIEECHNIIKYCKNMSASLQRRIHEKRS